MSTTQDTRKKITGALSTNEIDKAEQYWIQVMQKQHFPDELRQLKAGKEVNRQSKIKTLTPFIDEYGTLQVGGRLQMANLNFDQKHPVILSTCSKFSELNVTRAYNQVMHSGPQDTLAQVREKFRILIERQLTKRMVHACLICHRYKAEPTLPPRSSAGYDAVNTTQKDVNKRRKYRRGLLNSF